jgi:uncharacterized glyoxalase superfamily protein PhnB
MTAFSITSSVDVDVDPDTAFAIFTDELGLWVIQGPINFFDTARAYGWRMEPGVGGRIVEVYDVDTGEGLELARITTWEPGRHLAWTSSVDDVSIDVHFTASGGQTHVEVQATIPEGGRDQGGTSWIRMTPVWLGAWCAKRDHVPHEPVKMSRLAVAVYYERPAAAARYLHTTFGFEVAGNLPTEEPVGLSWIELRVGQASLMVFEQPVGEPPTADTHEPWVFVDDLDDHFAHAKAAGATIVKDIWQHGFRAYEAADMEGHRWTFVQASPVMRA